MLNASHRIQRVDAPIIPTVAALVRDNPGTISLGQGVVNYGPPQAALQAIGPMTEIGSNHKYQAVEGLASLHQALRTKLARENGISGDGLAIQVTAGSNMAFLNAVIAVGDPGDEFILPLPYYFNQEMAIRMLDCVPVCVPTDAQFQLDLAAIERAITPRTRAIVTVSPNNPSGAVYDEASLRAVSQLCRERGLYHFSDEAYEYFVHDGVQHFSPASIPGAADYTFSFFSFSKTYGMASWRVGYVVYPAHLAESMNKVQDTNLICAPVVSQTVALAALQLGKSAIQPHLDALARVRTGVYKALQELSGIAEFPVTQGAFYVLMKLPGLAPGTDPLAFNRDMAVHHKVATVPGFAFGLTDVSRANYQRLSYGALDEATVHEGVQRYVRAVLAWYGR